MTIENGVVHFDVTTLQFLVYTVIPFLVDLVTQRFSDGRVKAAILAVFAAVVAVAQEALVDDGDFYIPAVIGKFITALVTAFFVHKFIWEPARVTGDKGMILRKIPDGIGRVDPAKRTAAIGSR